jgi:D-beta-D-heptose 7-phosphate kinase/D-beta-D-heptose 1-phosphate adenosyltransferase
MNPNLVGQVRAFRGTRILVLGEAMLDSYLHGNAERLSREAPVPIVALDGRIDAPGGAANTAVNLAALDAEPILLSVVGEDGEAERLRRALDRAGVGTDHLIVAADRQTLAKERVLAADQMLVRVDSGTTDALGPDVEDDLIARLTTAYETADAVIVSDYDYGVATPRLIAALGELEARDPRPLIVDARDLRRYRRLPVTAVKPNYGEAVRLLGEPEQRGTKARSAQVGAAGERLLEITGAQIAAVTIDTDGVFVFERGAPPYRTYCRPRAAAQATGGGDTFVATLALALATGATTPEAAELASTAAMVVVGKFGTASCSARDLELALSVGGKRIRDRDELAARVSYFRRQGMRLVFTNGCFDILHRGHIAYLNRAKALGDVLIVGVNSDESVQRLKGPDRPINDLEDRLQVLEALSCVDLVVEFGEDTPEALLRIVRPDVFAKGGDYSRASLPEAPLVEGLGGSVQILPLVDGRSTTRIIARVESARDARSREPAPVGGGGRR